MTRGRPRGRRLAVAFALVAAATGLSGVVAPTAGAGTYEVVACRAAKQYGNDSRAFGLRRSSKRMVTRRDCSESGRGEGGLVTRSRVHRGRVRYGSYAFASFKAPPGTAFVSMRWSGAYQRLDCDWSAQLYAQGRGRARLLRGLSATSRRKCKKKAIPRVAASRIPRPRTVRLGGTTKLVQRVICARRKGCSTARLRKGARAAFTTYYAKVKLADIQRPVVRITGGGLASGRWVRGVQDLRFTATDNTGIAGARVTAAGADILGDSRPCRGSRAVPCPNGPGTIRVPTSGIPDGRQPLVVQAYDPSGTPGFARGTALIDNTPPARVPLGVVGGERWRNANSFIAAWTNPREAFAPIVAARYALCAAGTTRCTSHRAIGSGLSRLPAIRVPAPGQWTLRLWREDAAGNAEPALASDPVTLRYDPEAPKVGFEAQSISDPTRVSAAVTDRISGLAGGEIELRRRGTRSWNTLATAHTGSRLVAHVDDSRFPAGTYDLRARAFDQAGNEATTFRQLNGSPMTLTLPLRIQPVLKVGVIGHRIVRKTIRRNGKRRRIRRRKTVLRSKARIGFRRRAAIGGTVKSRDGQPLPGSRLLVYSVGGSVSPRLVGYANTDRRGRFRYRTRALYTRRLVFAYVGNALVGPAQGTVTTLVPSSTTIKPSRRRTTNGKSVLFRGRMRARPVPRGGKLVELQAHFRGRWRTFQTVRSDRAGRWKFRYRFGATAGTVRYRFRARLPREGGYPFETGRSRTVAVKVTGR